jgi:hypothetical protein
MNEESIKRNVVRRTDLCLGTVYCLNGEAGECGKPMNTKAVDSEYAS